MAIVVGADLKGTRLKDVVKNFLVEEGSCLAEAHNSQTAMLVREASGEELTYSVTMMHGQDHLMTTVLLKDVIPHLIELYKRGAK